MLAINANNYLFKQPNIHKRQIIHPTFGWAEEYTLSWAFAAGPRQPEPAAAPKLLRQP